MSIKILLVCIFGVMAIFLVGAIAAFLTHKSVVMAMINPDVAKVSSKCGGDVECIVQESAKKQSVLPCVLLAGEGEEQACQKLVVTQREFKGTSCAQVPMGVRQECLDATMFLEDPWGAELEPIVSASVTEQYGEEWQQQCIPSIMNSQIEVAKAKFYIQMSCSLDNVPQESVLSIVLQKDDEWKSTFIERFEATDERLPKEIREKMKVASNSAVVKSVLLWWKHGMIIQVDRSHIFELSCGCSQSL